jgi:hypothetical protein
MKAIAEFRRRSYLKLLIFPLSLVAIGCGGSSYSTSPQPSPSPGAQSMQGSWTIAFHSDLSDNYTVLEANLSQAGTRVFAGATSALVYQGTTLQPTIPLASFGNKCDSGGVGSVTFDGTLTNKPATGEAINFTLTEDGELGIAVITASGSLNGGMSLDGTYTVPAACGYHEDHGTLHGYLSSAKFSGGSSYSGTFQSDAIVVRFTSESSGFGVSATGTDNGAPFALTGSTTGLSLTLTGTISGRAVTWFGLFDSTQNTFLIYDIDAKLLGQLQVVGSPWDY